MEAGKESGCLKEGGFDRTNTLLCGRLRREYLPSSPQAIKSTGRARLCGDLRVLWEGAFPLGTV